MSTDVRGGYVRHRDRMVAESVFQDVRDCLIAFRWMSGTTVKPVHSIYAPGSFGTVTTVPGQKLPLLGNIDITMIDYFPEQETRHGDSVGNKATNAQQLNTFAVAAASAGVGTPRELGSISEEVPYTVNMAFFANSDGLAQAVLNDLRDRYLGRVLRPQVIDLFDFNVDPEVPVVRMDVESFRYQGNTEVETPKGTFLYFAELLFVDEVD